MTDERYRPMTYEAIVERATRDDAFREGLEVAALVARSQGQGDGPPCPSGMVAVYLDRLAEGELP